MLNRMFRALTRQTRRGKVKTSTLLGSMAEQLDNMALIQEQLAGQPIDPAHAWACDETAKCLRTMADNIRLHALTHVGDPPAEIPACEPDGKGGLTPLSGDTGRRPRPRQGQPIPGRPNKLRTGALRQTRGRA